MERLEGRGAKVDYHDPFIPCIGPTREHPGLTGRRSVGISTDFDVIVLSTAHDVFADLDFSNFPMPIVDTRNCLLKRNQKYYRA
jgi:UDP-N-acetyl-D-glucosamine dehydrogenase